jgi:hypothetical protein
MKRNLIKGIVLISAIALSSCSSTNKLAGVKNAVNDDDVYYTRAKSGDLQVNIASANQQNNGDDDYYYYGDYTSRLGRFANYSPFDYGDNFYYSYVPYNNGFGAGLDYDFDYYGNMRTANAPAPVDNGYIYSPYDYGYSPYYDMGYDDYGYGDVYSAFLFGGGYGGGGGSARLWHHNRSTSVANTTNASARGIRTTPSAGVTRLSSFPGRPLVSVNAVTGVVTRTNTNGLNNTYNNNTATRQNRESYRPQPQQQQSMAPSQSSSSSSSSNTSSGGGGRPVRP